MGRVSRWCLLLSSLSWSLGFPVQAGEVGKEKPASEWSLEEALDLLTHSPWAKEESITWVDPLEAGEIPRSSRVGFGVSLGQPPRAPAEDPSRPGSDVRPETPSYELVSASYLLRWESAEPVAQAFARLRELGELATAHFQAPPSRLPEDRYVVTVKTTRPPDPHPDIFLGLSDAELRERAQLKTAAGRVQPMEVERSGVGATAAVHFFFPRVAGARPLLPPGRQDAEFTFRAEKALLRTKFNLEL